MDDKNTLPEGWGDQTDSEEMSPWEQNEDAFNEDSDTAPKPFAADMNDFYINKQNNTVLYMIIWILASIIIVGSIVIIFYLKNQKNSQNTLQQDEPMIESTLMLENEALSESDESPELVQTEAVKASEISIESTFSESSKPATLTIAHTEAIQNRTTQTMTASVEKRSVSIVVPSHLEEVGYGTPNSSDGFLNLRSDPSLSDNIITEIPNGASIYMYSFGNDNWYFIEYGSYKGYVKKSYVISENEQQQVQSQVTPSSAAPAREDVIAAYKTAIYSKFIVASSYNSGFAVVEYALYDMDHDGIPELLVKYGTCEADNFIAIYTYRNGALKLIADDISGGHTFFGYDYVADQIVLGWGHMNYGNMTWYDLDENGEPRFLIETDGFEFAGDHPDYTYYMKKYNVGYLDSSEFFGTDTTWIHHYSNYEIQTAEYGGFDYRYLENYPF